MVTKVQDMGKLRPNKLVLLMAVAVFAVAVATASVGVAYADSDSVDCDCTWMQEVFALIDTGGPGTVHFWTVLDNNTVHGSKTGQCPYAECMFIYKSSHPPFGRQIDTLRAWGPPVVFINWFQCDFI